MNERDEVRRDVTRNGFRALNSIVEPVLTAGIANPLPVGSGAIVLETIGRKSGLPRRVPLLASRLGSRLIVSTVRDDSQWLRNIEADPCVSVWLAGKARAATARVTRGPLNVVTIKLA